MNAWKKWLNFLPFILIILGCGLTSTPIPPTVPFPTPGVLFPTPVPGASPTFGPSSTPAPGSATVIFPPQTEAPETGEKEWLPPYGGQPGPTQITPIPPPAEPLNQSDSITFLFIGSDRFTRSFRTDSLILANIQPEFKVVSLVSIPRDFFVYIPGWKMQRINAAYFHGELGYYAGGGAALLKDTILYNLGVKVDHIAMVDFDGFRNLIDTIEGIDIPVACSFTDWRVIDPSANLQDEENWYLHTIDPGITHMDGDMALWYARSRLKSSDFDRARRQQEVLRAAFQKSLQLNMITRIPQLYESFREMIFTDLSLEDLISLAPFGFDLRSAQIRSYYINTLSARAWKSPEGAYYLLPIKQRIKSIMIDAFSPPSFEERIHLGSVVEVWNGTNNPGWDSLAVERLNYGGFESQVNLADNRDYSKTLLYDYTFEQDTERSSALLDVLELSSTRLVKQPKNDSRFSYRLILGEDYRPCFNPAKIRQ